MELVHKGGIFRPLTENPFLRLATVFVFYIFEGVPMGLFYIAVPAYLAAQGANAVMIAAVVSAFSLPWTFKLVNGFFMDRYTYLPMGRRRIWIIGSQSTMVAGFLAGALIGPGPGDIWLLSALAFAISAATTFQDVSIDSLVVDILDEEEQAKAGGIMFGAQMIGLSSAGAAGGYLLEAGGFRLVSVAAAALLSIGVGFAILLRERPGEKRFPWGQGEPHPRNLAIRIDAWWPLLKQAFKAIFGGASLAIVPFLLIRNISGGVNDVWNPLLASNFVGWSTTQFTNTFSLAGLGSGLVALALGGILTAKIGSVRMIAAMFAMLALEYGAMAMLREQWSDARLLTAFLWLTEMTQILIAVAIIPLAMQVCSPAVAATQFTIYMALANFGRPIGAQMAGLIGRDDPQTLYLVLAAILASGSCGAMFLRRGQPSAAIARATHYGVGAAPEEN